MRLLLLCHLTLLARHLPILHFEIGVLVCKLIRLVRLKRFSCQTVDDCQIKDHNM